VSEPPPTPVIAAAVVLQIAGRPGPAFRLDPAGENVLGRAGGSLVALADRLASRQHAAIRFDAERATWLLRDLGSRNGTWLDGVRITSAPLAPGGQIRIGTTELVSQPVAAERMPRGDEPAAANRRLADHLREVRASGELMPPWGLIAMASSLLVRPRFVRLYSLGFAF
jgi:hypothetical protein